MFMPNTWSNILTNKGCWHASWLNIKLFILNSGQAVSYWELATAYLHQHVGFGIIWCTNYWLSKNNVRCCPEIGSRYFRLRIGILEYLGLFSIHTKFVDAYIGPSTVWYICSVSTTETINRALLFIKHSLSHIFTLIKT
jgi:hypothetical protein